MADHLRKRIRHAAATRLTGLATTGSRVYRARVYPLEDANLPGLLIYTNAERSERMTMPAPGVLERRLELVVEGYAKDTTDLDDTLDQIAKEVEVAIAGDFGLGGLAKVASLTTTEVEMVNGAEVPVGMIRLTFEVRYMALEEAPDTPQ